MEGSCKPIELQPFLHQVGGHTSMLCFNEWTICKPLIKQENYFYKTVPKELKPFIPDYRGSIEAMFHKQMNGQVSMIAYPPSALIKESYKKNRSKLNTPLVDSDSEDIEYSSTSQCLQSFDESSNSNDSLDHQRTHHSCIEADTAYCEGNPWSQRCLDTRLARLSQASDAMNSEEYILLENLACGYDMPCILDLKMGTRQHGDDATPEKKKSHILKCESTTSAQLGFRLCGMQVYQRNSGDFLCHNKYYGRRLNPTSVIATLSQFLHNGYRSRCELLDSIIHQLSDLSKILSCMSTYRFYSSSLLIMYEGNTDIESPASPRIRMIDFAHTTNIGHSGVDEGYLLGIDNVSKIFTSIRDAS